MPEEVIEKVAERHSRSPERKTGLGPSRPPSRAEIEKSLLAAAIELEEAFCARLPLKQRAPDHRTLGELIREVEEKHLLGKV